MKSFKTLNNIDPIGIDIFSNAGFKETDSDKPDIYLVRSADMHQYSFSKNLLAVGRAGAGVNNIPIDNLSGLGIPVFNAPGANANAVKELVIASILTSARNLIEASNYVANLDSSDPNLKSNIEKGKKQFVGHELPDKTLGVIGLGAIGVQVANTALSLGMKVVGFDPSITVSSAWQLSSDVVKANSLNDLLSKSDYITIHVPLLESTKGLINTKHVSVIKDNATILNFSRDGIIDDDALTSLLENKLARYVTDFAQPALMNNAKVLCFPHLGASTYEAERNCAVMVCKNIRDFIEMGIIRNSVNLPDISIEGNPTNRLVIINKNVPNMVGQITSLLASKNINISNFVNVSKGDIAINLVDLDSKVSDDAISEISKINGILSARSITK